MNSINDLFQMVLTQLEGSFPKTTINAWFSDAEAIKLDGNTFVLAAANQFKKELIESRFTTALEEALTDLLGEKITLVVRDKEKMDEDQPKEAAAATTAYGDYTFDNFIVGSSNTLAHSAAKAVAYEQTDIYNPLFIYGQSGLGKTHLLHAIGNVIHASHPDFNIIYIKGEEFTNQLIIAISEGQMDQFRNKYRQADLLLIDDIQFIAGKERTQEEFFHTFNAIYEAGHQIVLTSDRPPKEMNTLEDRMKTRFEWGLLVDIQPPDYETRIAIINAKAKKLNVTIPTEIIYCIAENLQSNVRQLEGTVKKIKAKNQLSGEPITINMARGVIEEVKSIQPGLHPTPPMILQAVSNFYSVPVNQMLSKNKSKDVVQPRQMAMYLVRKLTNYSLPETGKVFSRDHTTVMHACDKIDKDRKINAELDDIIKTLIENIQNM